MTMCAIRHVSQNLLACLQILPALHEMAAPDQAGAIAKPCSLCSMRLMMMMMMGMS